MAEKDSKSGGRRNLPHQLKVPGLRIVRPKPVNRRERKYVPNHDVDLLVQFARG